jgi:hypothetical protein
MYNQQNDSKSQKINDYNINFFIKKVPLGNCKLDVQTIELIQVTSSLWKAYSQIKESNKKIP